jgi:hypothetical protein
MTIFPAGWLLGDGSFIHSVLSSSELISDVCWHYKEDFDALNEGGQIRTINQDN